MNNKHAEDILIEVDYERNVPLYWYYFRGCPEIKVYIRVWNSATVIIEHKQKDSSGEWTEEYDGPELYVKDSSLFDMVSAGVCDALIGKGYDGAVAIFIDELPKSSQNFIINNLKLGKYVKWSNKGE